MVHSVPKAGMLSTNGRYSMYQRLVLRIPKRGTSCTNVWYFPYQRLVFRVPKHGITLVHVTCLWKVACETCLQTCRKRSVSFAKICSAARFPPGWGVLSA
ncbi:hypothetical protein DWW16_12220 [Bacteroides clarus]|uniref:Uncharacterized protein n=2 Tax=Bacteroides clarus TaxID=626929 RepID=A0A412Y733_9BACE|nr:hypothetical protein DWW16_12220 [Bacteroides clarus]RGV53280.1 hypothetical protein DWW09_10485 [Bacteroides clarus]